MKTSSKLLLGALIATIGIIGGIVLAPFIRMFHGINLDVRRSNEERVQLLYQTDHAALLAACRSLMTNRNAFTREGSSPSTNHTHESFIDPKNTNLPPIIQKLEPSYIEVTDEYLSLELHGGFDHYGVEAVSERAMTNEGNGLSGPFELIPGLWYYDEGLTYNRDRWMKKLRKMKPSEAAVPTW